MEDTITKLLDRLLSRDLIYILGGSVVIASLHVLFPELSAWPKGNKFYLLLLVFIASAYSIAYFLTELFSLARWNVNHEWWLADDSWKGELASWAHKRIHGYPLLIKEEPSEVGPNDTPMVAADRRMMRIVWGLREVRERSAYPYFIENFDNDIEKRFWVQRLTWLRFFGAIMGSCFTVAGGILIIAFLAHNRSCQWLLFGGGCLVLGLGLSFHTYYRSAQIAVIRAVLLTRPIENRPAAEQPE